VGWQGVDLHFPLATLAAVIEGCWRSNARVARGFKSGPPPFNKLLKIGRSLPLSSDGWPKLKVALGAAGRACARSHRKRSTYVREDDGQRVRGCAVPDRCEQSEHAPGLRRSFAPTQARWAGDGERPGDVTAKCRTEFAATRCRVWRISGRSIRSA